MCRCSRSRRASSTDPRYPGNPTNRCYYCKSELWTRLREVALARRFDTIIDGTNADDLGEHRPGLRAADEHAVRSPLAELGWTKARVREASRAARTPDLGRPRGALPVEPGGLRARDHAAAAAPGRGWRSLPARARRRGRSPRAASRRAGAPRGEPGRDAAACGAWDAVVGRVRGLGFAAVELDPAGYRRGGLLTLASPPPTDAAVRRGADRRRRAAGDRRAAGPAAGARLASPLGARRGSHLTLKFYGEVAPERLDVIEESVRFAAARAPGPLAFQLGELGAFPSRVAATGALGRHRGAAGAGSPAGPPRALRRGDRLPAGGGALPASRHAGSSARGATAAARRAGRASGGLRPHGVRRRPAGPVRERADQSGPAL